MLDAHLSFVLTPGECGGPLRMHLGVCGSVAAYKGLDLVRMWQDAGLCLSVTLTPSAVKFVTPLPFEALGAAPVYTGIHGDPRAATPFAHLEPAQAARAFVIAPATAATISRLAHGLADELLACQALAFGGQPVIAPAMNPSMWEHPATQANVDILLARGCRILPPAAGRTACGDMGRGRLADVRAVYLAALHAILPKPLAGRKAMVTLGPTREPWDGVRFWTNASTGTMGASLALALWLYGADVTAVCGPCGVWLPDAETASAMGNAFVRINVTSAAEMFGAASDLWGGMDYGAFTAAVADFAPERTSAGKFKKADAPEGFDLRFVPNPDILRTLSLSRRKGQRVLGFAAEARDLERAVHAKLAAKKADIIVGNLLSDGFGTSDDTVFSADAYGRSERWTSVPKPQIAQRLVRWLASFPD